jgi:hypothetical protein
VARVPVRHAALAARDAVGGAAQMLLVAGAVAGAAALLHRTNAVVSLSWLVGLGVAGWVGAVLWAVRSGERHPGRVRDAAGWATTSLVAGSLVVTSPDLFARMFLLLAVLVVIGLRLTVLAEPNGPAAPAAPPTSAGAPGVGARTGREP